MSLEGGKPHPPSRADLVFSAFLLPSCHLRGTWGCFRGTGSLGEGAAARKGSGLRVEGGGGGTGVTGSEKRLNTFRSPRWVVTLLLEGESVGFLVGRGEGCHQSSFQFFPAACLLPQGDVNLSSPPFLFLSL